MHLEIYQVDAFCRELFTGNPAAVCPLEYWPDDRLLQNIAMENNLAETSFFVHAGDHFEIRWFTQRLKWHCADMPRSQRLMFYTTT